MFNISFGEVVLVAVVGLIVIGPRRLPETARFVGHLVSRVQRQVAGVKADIRREMDLEDLKSIQREYENTAREIGDDFKTSARELHNAADSVRTSVDAPADASTGTPARSEISAKERGQNADARENVVPQKSQIPQTPWPTNPTGDSAAAAEKNAAQIPNSDSEKDRNVAEVSDAAAVEKNNRAEVSAAENAAEDGAQKTASAHSSAEKSSAGR
ncbi:MAG: Sec-independent protein translocase protein TatB [Gammaproteobacteria bacterium]